MSSAPALRIDPEPVANLNHAPRRKPSLRLVESAETGTIHSVFGPDGNRIAEYDEATGTLLRQYVWIGLRPIAVPEGTARTRFFTRVDYIGRPIYATNTSGVKQWTAKYLPFGGVQATTGSPIALRFPGQWFQAETGLHQNWMRDYDPTTGRDIQADPLGLVDGASVYGYALQSPERYVDPNGEDAVAVAIGGAIDAAGAGAAAAGAAIAAAIAIVVYPTNVGVDVSPWDLPDADVDYFDDCDKWTECSKATKWQLKQAGLYGSEHAFKAEYVGKKAVALFDICACDNGAIIIRNVGMCGLSGPSIMTYARWK
jgi:RHS repeat-associated protein